MPIYAYKCAACGLSKDVLQKLSDAPLAMCPACGEPTFHKQVTAAGFQLKGSGWYATDFKNGNGKKPAADQKDADATGSQGSGKVEAGTSDDGKKTGAKPDAGTTAPQAAEKPAVKPSSDAPKPAPSGG